MRAGAAAQGLGGCVGAVVVLRGPACQRVGHLGRGPGWVLRMAPVEGGVPGG